MVSLTLGILSVYTIRNLINVEKQDNSECPLAMVTEEEGIVVGLDTQVIDAMVGILTGGDITNGIW